MSICLNVPVTVTDVGTAGGETSIEGLTLLTLTEVDFAPNELIATTDTV